MNKNEFVHDLLGNLSTIATYVNIAEENKDFSKLSIVRESIKEIKNIVNKYIQSEAKISKKTYDLYLEKDSDGVLLNFESKITGELDDYFFLDAETIAKINAILLKGD